MLKLYCSCGEQLEVLNSDDSMPRTLACPKCVKEYELFIREIVKRSTRPTNTFYMFKHKYNGVIGLYPTYNKKEAYVTDYLFVEAINEYEAQDIVSELVNKPYDVKWDGGELFTKCIDQYVQDYVREFRSASSPCIVCRDGKIHQYFRVDLTERET